jgi:hypothetical protein
MVASFCLHALKYHFSSIWNKGSRSLTRPGIYGPREDQSWRNAIGSQFTPTGRDW